MPTKKKRPHAAVRSITKDTLILPHAVAEAVVSEVVSYLTLRGHEREADEIDGRRRSIEKKLTDDAERICAKNRGFQRMLNAGGNRGRDWLYSFMRHWLASQLLATGRGTYELLPRTFAMGRGLLH